MSSEAAATPAAEKEGSAAAAAAPAKMEEEVRTLRVAQPPSPPPPPLIVDFQLFSYQEQKQVCVDVFVVVVSSQGRISRCAQVSNVCFHDSPPPGKRRLFYVRRFKVHHATLTLSSHKNKQKVKK